MFVSEILKPVKEGFI